MGLQDSCVKNSATAQCLMHFDMTNSESSNQIQNLMFTNLYPTATWSARDKQFGTCSASRSHHLCETP